MTLSFVATVTRKKGCVSLQKKKKKGAKQTVCSPSALLPVSWFPSRNVRRSLQPHGLVQRALFLRSDSLFCFYIKTRTDDSSVSVGDPSYLSSLLVSESTVVSLHVLSDISSPSPPGNGPSNATVVLACRWVGGGGGLCTCGAGVLGVLAVSCSHCTEI